jgi:Caspase domain
MSCACEFRLLIVVCALLAACNVQAASRRALLIGINDYTASRIASQPPLSAPPPRDWPNLLGAVNDVNALKEMLTLLYDFNERDIVTLTDQAATRAAIMGALEKHLAKPAAKGDVLLFYFAGHGSQVLNSRSDEPDKLDESIVPADSRLGARDIRDKELRPIFNRILDRGARLSIILDNCHSGSGARGLSTGARPRGVRADLRDVADGRSGGPRPEERGALVLSATQDFDAAWETRDEEGKMHGAFSWAWIRAMRDSTAGESAADTFARASARLRSEKPFQEPVLAGSREVTRRPFLGIRKDRRNDRTIISVEKVRSDGTVSLQGGWVNGLSVGSELRVWNDPATAARITITAIHGLGRSEGRVPAGTPMPRSIRSGALLEVVGWAAPPGRPLRVQMPRVTESIEAIAALARKLAAEAERRGLRWIDDPLETTPSFLLRRGNLCWELLGANGIEHLGPHNADAIAGIAKLPAASSLFVQLPAPGALIDAIDIGPGNIGEGIDRTHRAEEADYILVGRLSNGRIEYAWMRPSTKASDRRKVGLPLRTAWIADTPRNTAITLGDAVVRLRKIQAWNDLDSPAEARFPYRLGLRRERGGAWANDGAVIGDEKYEIVLRAKAPLPARIRPRYVYAFTIDSHGESILLYPRSGSVENRFPLPPPKGTAPAPPAEIPLGVAGTFEITPPYGVDTYFLLTTDEPLPNPWILEWDGVRALAPRPRTALEELLLLTASGSRGRLRATPSNWSIERAFFESVPLRQSKNLHGPHHKSGALVSERATSSPRAHPTGVIHSCTHTGWVPRQRGSLVFRSASQGMGARRVAAASVTHPLASRDAYETVDVPVSDRTVDLSIADDGDRRRHPLGQTDANGFRGA